MFSKKNFLKIFLFLSLFNNKILSSKSNSLNQGFSPDFSSNNPQNLENLSEEEMMKMFENMSEEEIFNMMENMFYNSYQSLSDEEKDMVAKELQVSREDLESQVNSHNGKNNNNLKTEETPKTEEKKPEIKKVEKKDDLKKIKEEISIFEDAENILSNFLSKSTEKTLFETSVKNFPTLISDTEISIYYIKFIIPLLKDFLQKEEKKNDFEKIKNILKKTINLKDSVINIQTNSLKKVISESEINLLQKYSSRNKAEAEKKINDLIEIKSKVINEIKNDKSIEKSKKEKKITHEKFLLIELENDLEKVKQSDIELENKNLTKNISKQTEIVKKNFLEAATEINKLYPELLDLLENFIKINIPDEYKKLKENTDIIKKAYEEEKNIYLNNSKKSQGSISTENLKSEPRYNNNNSNYSNENSDYYQSNDGYYNDNDDYYGSDSDFSNQKTNKENDSENKDFVGEGGEYGPTKSQFPKSRNQVNSNFNKNNFERNSQKQNFKKEKKNNKKTEENESIKEKFKKFEKDFEDYKLILEDKNDNNKQKNLNLKKDLNYKIKDFIENLNLKELNEAKLYFPEILKKIFKFKEEKKTSAEIKEIKDNISNKINELYKSSLPEEYLFLQENNKEQEEEQEQEQEKEKEQEEEENNENKQALNENEKMKIDNFIKK